MNAVPPDFAPFGKRPTVSPERLVARWDALTQAARAIATLAGPEAQADCARELAWPEGLADLPASRSALVEDTLDDLIAVMEPGLTALIAAHERGGQTAPAAQALWREFTRARVGLLALVPPVN